MTISFRNCQRKAKAKAKARSNGKGKGNGNGESKSKGKSKAKANTGISPLRCASVEMTEFGWERREHERLGVEAEVFYPVELGGGVGDEGAAGLGDAAEGVVGGEAFAAEEGG